MDRTYGITLQVENVRYWECRMRSHKKDDEKCRIKALSEGSGEALRIIRCENDNHNHEPDASYVQKLKLAADLKTRGLMDDSTPAKIMRAAGNQFPAIVQGRFSAAAQKKLLNERDTLKASRSQQL